MLPLHHHQTTTADRVAAVEAQIESERRQHEVVLSLCPCHALLDCVYK